MSNDELKKKIVAIVNEWHWFQKRDANGNTIWQANDTEKLATTLISAGIGDVKEAEHRAEVAEFALYRSCGPYSYGFELKRAEQLLAEEGKDD